MTHRTTTAAAQAAVQFVLTEAERHQLLVRANYPHRQEDPRAYLVKITEEMVLSKLRAPVAVGTNGILEAAREVLRWTEVLHRPPVREKFPAGGTARVRIHALADLHDAVNAALSAQPGAQKGGNDA